MHNDRKSIFKEERLQKIMNFIDSYKREKGYAPTIKEISEAIGVQSTSLSNYYVQILVKKGYLSKEDNISRSLQIIRPYDKNIEEITPLTVINKEKSAVIIPVSGEISGEKLLDLSSLDKKSDGKDRLEVALDNLPGFNDGKEYRVVRVSDDSFVEHSIIKGDYIVFFETVSIEEAGSYIVCDTENESTRLFRCNDMSVSVQTEQVIGKAVLMVRKI